MGKMKRRYSGDLAEILRRYCGDSAAPAGALPIPNPDQARGNVATKVKGTAAEREAPHSP